jgi:hypothetical protein
MATVIELFPGNESVQPPLHTKLGEVAVRLAEQPDAAADAIPDEALVFGHPTSDAAADAARMAIAAIHHETAQQGATHAAAA